MQQLDEIDIPLKTVPVKQIHTITNKDLRALEFEVNTWLSDHSDYEIIDIQYQQHLSFTCMIVFVGETDVK